jgi:hypothetical protein
MNKLLALAALAATATLATPGAAQTQAAQARSQPHAFVAMRNFSRCVVERSPHGVELVLAMDPTSNSYRDGLRRLAEGHSDCAPGTRLQFSGIFFAGGLAEALVSGGRAGALGPRVALDPARPAIQARDETEVMTLCTVRRAPEEVAALFAAEPSSDAEREAMRVLAPTVGACLAAGQTLRLNRPNLRALLALSAHRLIVHNSAPPPAN